MELIAPARTLSNGWAHDASTTSRRHALVLPRRWVGTDSPLLMYPALAAAERGATTQHVQWDGELVPSEDAASKNAWVRTLVAAELDLMLAGGSDGLDPLIIASSLSTRAAPLAAERNIPGIWITPILRSDPSVAEALSRSHAPALLVGGTDDPEWDGDVARAVSRHVLEIPGADHSLMLPGALGASVTALSRLVAGVEEFLDDVVGWRSHRR